MNDAAYEQLIERLGRDSAIASRAVDVILAAAEGADALDAHLDGGPAPPPRPTTAPAETPAPRRVYLEHVLVERFRGVGPAAKLQIAPGPGLTLVVGRNGSGKSSFAEGLELLLTSTNLRWEGKTKVWREGWRNLHDTGPTRLAARFRVDGAAAALEIERSWAPGSQLVDGDPVSVSGACESWEKLAWDEPLHRFRPLLSYSELGAMFSTRAATLYEALSAVLGLQEFDELAGTVRTARLAREKTGKSEKRERDTLRILAQGSDDDRAATLHALLAKRAVDLEKVDALIRGDGADASGQAELTALATLTAPAAADVRRAFDAVTEADREISALEATDAERLDALAELLGRALRFHERHGDTDQTCPVCGATDRLDAGWSLRSQAEVQELRASSAALRAARQRAQAARDEVGRLFSTSTPATLRGAHDAGLDVHGALEAWDAWSTSATPDAVLAELARDALQSAVARACELQQERDLDWQPVRVAATQWLATAHDAVRDTSAVAMLKTAEAWMSSCMASLRRERLTPVVEAARENWRHLRHESNVTLGDVELRKEGMQRYAAFDVAVDGTAASAFGVMSQGELSALAISIFLPRAALPESPFGFMVIDDPVQSMDPAKVDGLARVLAAAAKDRQVVVFTHDERLPEALRRLSIDARMVNVKRRARSKVELVAGRPPSDRYIGEALALAKTDHVTAEVRMRVIPGFCRGAIEAACEAALRRRGVEAGLSHAGVDEQIEALTSLTTWLAAAFGLSESQGHEINDRLRRIGGEDAVRAIRDIKRGSHEPVAFDHLALIASTKRIVSAIEP